VVVKSRLGWWVEKENTERERRYICVSNIMRKKAAEFELILIVPYSIRDE